MSEGTCPICQRQTGHINNHVRMKNGGGHGPQGQYPKGWDTGQSAFAGGWEPGSQEEAAQAVAETLEAEGYEVVKSPGGADAGRPGSDGSEVEPIDVDEPDPLDDAQPFEVDDLLEETRTYDCGSCGEPIEYLGGDDLDDGGKACPECGDQIFWSLVDD